MEEQKLVFCSALKWRVAIATKWKVPMAKPAIVWPLGTSWNPLTQKGWVLWFGWGSHCTSFKKKWLLSTQLKKNNCTVFDRRTSLVHSTKKVHTTNQFCTYLVHPWGNLDVATTTKNTKYNTFLWFTGFSSKTRDYQSVSFYILLMPFLNFKARDC